MDLLSVQQVQAGAMVWPVVATVAFGVGTVLFLVELGFRATVTVRVATAKAVVPDWYDPLATWAGARTGPTCRWRTSAWQRPASGSCRPAS